ncbi:hypothetical protein EDB81DRAFT_669295 [Dactylonectria macrodidyma]|uniref:Uncharacterized protein n=1 Tax=Dactylonectria macrodidyma TaxID=307937 RepID=A0A9P9D8U4_9HYPO|nr:hypothetical protein EDB81DRAFT_669295 [Dactylonectria macrodidyma]
MEKNKKTGVAEISAAATGGIELVQLLRLDVTPWYKKPNLRRLYLCLIPATLEVKMATWYDGSI